MSKLQHTDFYQSIHTILKNARRKVATTVNFAMVEAYWQIGRMIVEEEQEGKTRSIYGTNLLSKLSIQLTIDFGKGFDPSNLRNMRIFYQAFPNRDALRHNLSWTHYRLLARIQKVPARQFYLNEAIEEQWSTRTLERQINSFYYERLLSSQDKRAMLTETTQNKSTLQPEDILKDPMVLEFLQLQDNSNFREKELETALLDKLKIFLLELGKGFSFVARQKRISADTDHFFIDLVFYNYLLKCFVLVDLKIGKLTHQDVGQLDFYVRYWEDHFKTEGDNPTIGIILCSEKNETIIKYSVLEDSRQLFVSKYMLHLPTEEELGRELNRELSAIRRLKEL